MSTSSPGENEPKTATGKDAETSQLPAPDGPDKTVGEEPQADDAQLPQPGVGEMDRPELEVWRNTGGWGTLCSEAWLPQR